MNTHIRPHRVTAILRALALTMALCLVAACGTAPAEESASTSAPSPSSVPTTATTAEDHEHADDDHEDHDETETGDVARVDEARRLLVVTPLDEPMVELIDLDDESGAALELGSPALLSSAMTSDSRFLLAGHEEGVTIVDTGVWSVRHGDHFDHYSTDPEVLGFVDGPNPTHLISHGGVSALYFDGSGEAIMVDEGHLADGQIEESGRLTTSRPHHGFAVPLGDHAVVTVPSDDTEGMPDLVGVANPDGEIEVEVGCTETHGEAGLDHGAAAACSDGIALLTEGGTGWVTSHIPYPEVDDVDPYGYDQPRAWTLTRSEETGLIAAPFGSRHVLVLDPADESLSIHDIGADVATFGVEFHDETGVLVVVTLDGLLRLVDPDDGSELGSIEVMQPFEEGTEEPYRRLTINADEAYVSDPADPGVIEVALDDLAITRTIDLDHAPGYIAVANRS